jgi:hypothetical protein
MSMGKIYRRATAIALLLLVCLAFACERKPSVITPQLVEQFLASVDAASAKRDPNVIIDHMAPDAVISVRMNGAAQVVRISGKDYKEKVKGELAVLKDYKYQRSDTKIEISKDQQKARVTMRISETMTAPNGTYRAETKQTTIYALKDGKLIIQSVDSDSNAIRQN